MAVTRRTAALDLLRDTDECAAGQAGRTGGTNTLYDQDFVEWCLQQARLLRAGEGNALDL